MPTNSWRIRQGSNTPRFTCKLYANPPMTISIQETLKWCIGINALRWWSCRFLNRREEIQAAVQIWKRRTCSRMDEMHLNWRMTMWNVYLKIVAPAEGLNKVIKFEKTQLCPVKLLQATIIQYIMKPLKIFLRRLIWHLTASHACRYGRTYQSLDHMSSDMMLPPLCFPELIRCDIILKSRWFEGIQHSRDSIEHRGIRSTDTTEHLHRCTSNTSLNTQQVHVAWEHSNG